MEQPSTSGAPNRTPRTAPGSRSPGAVILAVLLQVLVAGFTLNIGVGWPQGYAVTYFIALGQALLAFVVLAILASRRPRAVVLVPLVSVSLTILSLWISNQIGEGTACSEQERALFAELAPLPGVELELRGEPQNNCVARFTTDLSAEEVIAHYRAEFEANGWQVVPSGISGSPGEGIAAVKDRIVVEAVVEYGRGGLAFLSVYEQPG